MGSWDRLAIVALGAAGCALSYDALQQMAVAIHVRGFLTYLFPLVIDGFIAYGVRALLVLSAAPLRARLYVWTLFGTATFASIWANALHAVRLNQQTSQTGLRLGDMVVAVLSTLAPLALAGAVHLYILITRHHPADRSTRTSRTADQRTETAAQQPTPTHAPAMRDLDRPSGPVWATPDQTESPRPSDQDRPEDPVSGPGAESHPVSPARPQTDTGASRTEPIRPALQQRRTGQQAKSASARSAGPSEIAAGHPADSERTARTGVRGSDAAVSGTDRLAARSADQHGASAPVRRTGRSADRATGPAPDHSDVRSADQTDAPAPDQRSGPSADQAGPGLDQATGPSADERTGPNPDQPTASSTDQGAGPKPDRTGHVVAPASHAGNGDPVPFSVLLPIARQAALEEGRMTRAALRPYLRERNIPISNERFRELQERLYADKALAHLPRPKRKSQ
ncbi:hypothetical protein DMH18_26595 [Streptomyces sp. WAC 06783]|nr:hypothetical protein DMH18_26595 [Streptomyces sp. WAC 06783]